MLTPFKSGKVYFSPANFGKLILFLETQFKTMLMFPPLKWENLLNCSHFYENRKQQNVKYKLRKVLLPTVNTLIDPLIENNSLSDRL